MREYIVNLTDGLIGRNHFDGLSLVYSREGFLYHVRRELELGEVAVMSPETLGRIMGSLEIGDVMASKAELLGGLCFGGDCGDLLRELVSRCLSHVIYQRLEPDATRVPNIPAYRRNRNKENRNAK